MSASQISLYNGALSLLKHVELSALTDDIEVRYKLDNVWAGATNAVDYCLEQGFWHFAMRSGRFDSDPSFTAPFGYRNRFEKPSDWIRTAAVCSDEYFNAPLTQSLDEAGSWFADVDPLYARYVSNDRDWGGNLGAWPATFTLYVEAYLAKRVAPGLTASGELVKDIEKIEHKRLIDARSKAAMNESAQFLPMGRWVKSRYGRRVSSDRGSTSTLIG